MYSNVYAYSSVEHLNMCSVVIDPSSKGCSVVTSTHSQVGLVLSVCIVTFDLYSSWDLLETSRNCLVGRVWILTLVREGDGLRNWPVCVWMKDDQERKLWELSLVLQIFCRMFVIFAICSKMQILVCVSIFCGETTMNIIKFDCNQNKVKNLIPVKCFESKILKKCTCK